jgi:glycosyltransferase involved in cell wall biosynthesis
MPSVCLIDTLLSIPPFGGPIFFLGQLANQLRGRGWDVSIITQRGPDPRVRDALVRDGLDVVEGPWKPWHLPETKARLFREWVVETALDVFVISNCRDVSWLTLPFLPERVRAVSIAHHDVAAYYNPVQHYFPYIDLAVGVSPQIRDRLAVMPGAAPDRCRYIPYGVDVLDADRASAKVSAAGVPRFNIGYVGRVVENQKRVMSFPPLLRRLARRIPFHFHVIGDGPDRAALERAFAEHGVSDRISFLGWLEGEELRRRLEELDVLVMVSETEGLPIAMLEAMGHAVVPVVSEVGSGMSSVVEDGRNGFLIDFRDLATYAERIEWLFKDAGLLRTMQWKSWETAQGYKAEHMGASY